jgi:hypothetical protein
LRNALASARERARLVRRDFRQVWSPPHLPGLSRDGAGMKGIPPKSHAHT